MRVTHSRHEADDDTTTISRAMPNISIQEKAAQNDRMHVFTRGNASLVEENLHGSDAMLHFGTIGKLALFSDEHLDKNLGADSYLVIPPFVCCPWLIP
jgi:hypothetical protein